MPAYDYPLEVNRMNVLALVGILCLIYAALLVFFAVKKPTAIWKMGKIQFFIKLMGEKGTEYFFYAFAVLMAALGLWLLINK